MIRNGVDIIEIARIEAAINRYGQRFLERIYTQDELSESGQVVGSLAVRFAAKEAVAKALGTGIGDVCWQDIEIRRADSGAPILNLNGSAAIIAKSLGLNSWAISLSHTRTIAIASVVAFG